MTWELVLILIAIPLLWSLINFNNWYYLRQALKQHDAWLQANGDSSLAEEKAADWLVANQTEIKRRVEKAGIHGPRKTYMEPAGLGYASERSLNVLDNLLFRNEDILQEARQAIKIAKGHYLTQAKLALSPLHWVELILFLPREIISASGVEVSSNAMDIGLKLVQIVYWLALAITAIIGFMD